MALSMQSPANSILLDSLQPTARQPANTAAWESRMAALEEAAEIYQLYTITK